MVLQRSRYLSSMILSSRVRAVYMHMGKKKESLWVARPESGTFVPVSLARTQNSRVYK